MTTSWSLRRPGPSATDPERMLHQRLASLARGSYTIARRGAKFKAETERLRSAGQGYVDYGFPQ